MWKKIVGKTISAIREQEVDETGDGNKVTTAIKIEFSDGTHIQLLADCGTSWCYSYLREFDPNCLVNPTTWFNKEKIWK